MSKTIPQREFVPFSEKPLRPMTEAQVKAAAYADPDVRPMTSDELRRAKPIPGVKTLRRALGSARACSLPENAVDRRKYARSPDRAPE
jgi:hypothetical protein